MSLNTIQSCSEECVPVFQSGANIPTIDPVTCELNDCLECDADKSGAIFNAFAGRNRRRSNILTSTPRPCSELPVIMHKECSTEFHS